MRRKRIRDHHERDLAEIAAVKELDKIRAPLMRELRAMSERPGYLQGKPPHHCCTRHANQMRISPLEAQAIARAFRTDPKLRAKLPQVFERLSSELGLLEDNGDRQSFDCPLLEGTRCLVHDQAKPIGCAAWHPAAPGQRDYTFTTQGWKAFEKRDLLNDQFCGPHWKLRVIPLWLKRVFAPVLRTSRKGRKGEQCLASRRRSC